jgi:hypothetical protein
LENPDPIDHQILAVLPVVFTVVAIGTADIKAHDTDLGHPLPSLTTRVVIIMACPVLIPE